MNSVVRHHHLTGQADDGTTGTDGFTDPTDTTVAQWPGPDNFVRPFIAVSLPVTQTSSDQFSITTSDANVNPVPTIGSGTAAGLIINVTYDSSVTNLDTVGNAAYNPTLYAEYTSAVQAAVQFYESEITTPITLNISFGWGEVAGSVISTGALAQSSTFSSDYTYAQVLAAVQATDTTSAVQQAAVLSLPSKDPTKGATFAIATAEAKALGLDTTYTGTDGSVGLDSSQTFSWSQTGVTSGTYDAVGALEHEISEVMGRSDDAGVKNTYTLLDMFRYTAATGLSGAAPGSAVGERDQPFVAGYSTTAPASAVAGLNSYSYFSYNGTTITNQYDIPTQVAKGADVADWAAAVTDDSYGYSDQGHASLVTTTDLQEMNVLGYDLVACYLPDTRIATPAGEVPVQNLAVGDRVLTHGGEARSIVWIGQGKALATRGRRNAATPVIVRKGALGDNVPNRDLRITKGHALYLDGVLIPVEFLVNHRSIVWDDRAQEVTVYHVELAVHGVLLANGAPAESYRDDGNRWLFANSNPGWLQSSQPPCAPVLTGDPVVDAVWKRLLDRSGPRPGLPLTDDPDLHLSVDGRRVNGLCQENGMHAFRLPPRPSVVRIVSRAGAQDELGLARDPRVLGVAVRRIILWRGRHPTVMEADDPRLSQGFHAYEADNGFRWTDGDGLLPPMLFADGITDVDLHVASTTRYPLLRDDASVAA
jgi:Hint domain